MKTVKAVEKVNLVVMLSPIKGPSLGLITNCLFHTHTFILFACDLCNLVTFKTVLK